MSLIRICWTIGNYLECCDIFFELPGSVWCINARL